MMGREGGRAWSRAWERERARAAVVRAVSMAPPADARATTDRAGMLFMLLSAAAVLGGIGRGCRLARVAAAGVSSLRPFDAIETN